ncbi:MAG: DNA helicase RecQ [Clostridiales bacterium]|jgi:ATP-dependent DNA helicase RecQ|nr:DNA helicase RecQ [Clostridiales bacterium]
MTKSAQLLHEVFGYERFRPGQEEVIDCILGGGDVLAVLPTGAGKSVCFQIPALLSGGVTLVISPLISLMKDQIGALTAGGIAGAYLNGELTGAQQQKVLERAAQGAYTLMYVAPERLTDGRFLAFAHDKNTRIPLVAVDEAHCVSQWGNDFRPSYAGIEGFVSSLKTRPTVAAFTATATERVRADIVSMLKLQAPRLVVTGFDRENIRFSVVPGADKFADLLTVVKRHPNECGIVYAATRKTVEDVADRLTAAGYSAAAYHAGLAGRTRTENQEDFSFDRTQIIVATNAFGMGIDKSNVRYVVHYNSPKDIESYYQEAGRAGRDGGDAEAVLLFSPSDIVTAKFLIENSDDKEYASLQVEREQKELARKRLAVMERYCRTKQCLRKFILEYFGEPTAYEACGNCGNCDGGAAYADEDVTVLAQKIVSCVKRCGERFGKGMIVDILRGAKNKKVSAWGLEGLSTYGICTESAEKIGEVIAVLIEGDYLKRTTDSQYPTLVCGERAAALLGKDARLVARLAATDGAPAKAKPRAKADTHAGTEYDKALFERLRALRAEIAAQRRIPAYVVFPDTTLVSMSARKPDTEAELLDCSGVGQYKLALYGERFLEEIRKG